MAQPKRQVGSKNIRSVLGDELPEEFTVFLGDELPEDAYGYVSGDGDNEDDDALFHFCLSIQAVRQ